MDGHDSKHQTKKPREVKTPQAAHVSAGRNNAVASHRPQRHRSPSPSPSTYRHRSPSPSPSTYRHRSPSPSPSTYRHRSPSPSPSTYRHRSPSPSPSTYRHRSPSPSPLTTRHRSPSPSPSTLSPIACQSPPSRTVRLRSKSAERKHPSTLSSPSSLVSTPVKDSLVDIQIASGEVLSGCLPEGLWPSTMLNLIVSGDPSDDSLKSPSNVDEQVEASPVATKSTSEKRRSGNVSSNSLTGNVDLIDKMTMSSLPPISSRRMSLDGMVKPVQKTATDAARLPSTDDRVKIGLRSIDDNHLRVPRPKKFVTSKTSSVRSRPSSPSKYSPSSVIRGVSPSPTTKASTSRGISPTPATQSNTTRGISPTPARQSAYTRGTSPTPATQSTSKRGVSPSPTTKASSSRGVSPTPATQSNTARGISPTPARQSAYTRGISPTSARQSASKRGVSPSPARQSTSTRGISPTSTKSSTRSRGTSPAPASQSTSRGISPVPAIPPTPSRGTSPTPARPSTPSRQASPTPTSSSSASVLSFIADFRNGKKSSSNVEDAHQLRELYNRHLQWKFANARAAAAIHTKKEIAEKTLYNVWNDTLALCETVTLKRISLQQLRLELKLNSLINGQLLDNIKSEMTKINRQNEKWFAGTTSYSPKIDGLLIAFLHDWGLLERDHISSLSGASDDLKACTLRLPLTRGVKVDTDSLRLAVSSAVDVMQTMGSSISPLLSRVEMMNSLASEVGFVALQEIEMLEQCEALFASTAAVQVEEYSLRSHLIQMSDCKSNLPQTERV